MDPDPILIIALALLASAFASGVEIAFITSNKFKLELDKKQRVFGANIISYFSARPKMFVATMLVGNTIALVIYGIAMGDMITESLRAYFSSFYSGLGMYGVLAFQTLVSTIIILIFGEFIPKIIFSVNPNRWLNFLSVPILLWYIVLWIFSFVIMGISALFLRMFSVKRQNEETVSFGKVDLDHFLTEATGNIDRSKELDHEIQIFQNALDFSKVKARDCLVPRNEVVAIEITDRVEELRQRFIETHLSKILVYRENIDHIIGYVDSFELFKKPEHIQHILRPVIIVPEPMPANEILELFIQKKRSMAVVVDEFGGTAGIITMEDIVEEIFGEIEDEHDKEEIQDTLEERISEKEFIFSARIEIDYINDKYQIGLPVDAEEYDTLGGLILHHFEDIPDEGSVIHVENFTFTVLKVSETRVEEVKIDLD